MAITLGLTPGWAVADQGSCSSPNGRVQCTAAPDDIQDWKDFVSALVAHYDGTAHPHVRTYELWNEVNARNFWTGTDAQLVALAQAAYPIVHRDPHSILLTPSVAGPVGTTSATSAVNKMTSYLKAGGAAYADGGAYHGYPAQTGVRPFPMPEDDSTSGCTPFVSCFGSVVTKATQMRAVFDQNGLAGKPMFQTEGSWGNGNVTDPDTQVAWLARWILLQAGLRSSLNLQLASWYTWGGGASQSWGNIETDALAPTAAGVAWDQVYRWLVGATMAQPCSGGSDGTWSCTITRAGGYVGRILWNTKGTAPVTPGSGFTKVRDLAGTNTALAPGGSVTVGAKPVLVEGSSLALGSLDAMPQVKRLLIDQGTLFTNAYVPLSLCCPSRTALLRGQYPHNTGVMTNALPLGGFERVYEENLEASTVATLLHGAGYRTALMGKYLNGYPNLASPTYVPPGWDEWYSASAGNPYSEFNYTLNESGKQVKYGATPADYGTDVYLGKALGFIQRMAGQPAQPLFIYLATYAPHSPYTPAPRHAGLFPGVGAPRPPSFNEPDVSSKPAYIQSRPLLSDANIADIDASYRLRLQSLQAVDEAVAAIVQALAATGRLANTYIVFTADNAYHMGEHRLLPGKYTPYETDLHVPLIVRGPGVAAGAIRDDFVANLDLAETFADLAGVPALDFSDGRSLKGLFTASRPASWRQALLLEEFNGGIPEPTDNPAFGFPTAAESVDPSALAGLREPPDAGDLAPEAAVKPIPTYFGYQAAGYKYVEYETGEKELYVKGDPYELRNVAGKVAPEVGASLSAYLGTLEGCKTDTCRAAEAVAPPALLTASFTSSPANPASGATVTLTASATGTPPYTYSWTLDGAPRSGATATWSPSDGAHTVNLDVVDAIGAEAIVTRTVTVGTPPTVVIQAPSTDPTVEAGVAISFGATGSPSVPGGTIAFAWDFGDGTRSTGSTASHPYGLPGTYAVKLTGTDSRGAIATAVRTVTVTPPTLTGSSLLLPVVLETPGAGGSYYTSEVTIASRLTTPVDVLLTYTASLGGGTGYARLTLGPGQQQVVPGILGWLRGKGLPVPADSSTRAGTLLATFSGTASASGLFLGARTFTADPTGGSGTFGLYYLAAPSVPDTLTVFGLQQTSAQRSNLALVNTSGVPITLRAKLVGPTGQALTTVDTGLGPYGWAQLNSPLTGTGATSGVAQVSLVSGTGTFSAYGVLNDAVTSDGSFLPPLVADPSAPDRMIPIVLSVAGYATELTLTNLTASPLTLTLTYKASPQLGSGTGSGTATVTLAANEQRIAPDALGFLRQLGIPVPATGDAGGSLDVKASTGNASSFAAGARTFIGASGGGTFGLFYPGVTVGESAASVAYVGGLQQNGAQRSNVAVVNRGDASDTIALRITYYGPDGTQAGSPDTKSLAPGEWAQFNQPLSSRGVTAGWARVEKTSGNSRFVAYGVLNDQTNSDGSYIPMSR